MTPHDKQALPARPDLRALHAPLVALCRDAAAAILAIYDGDFDVRSKADDSPVTAADVAADRLLVAGLSELLPGVPVVSEESALAPWSVRRTWTRFWLVDPLDGTKEFIKRNGEFTVNVALVERGRPLLGVILQPTTGLWWLGQPGAGTWHGDARGGALLAPVERAMGRLRVAISRSHRSRAAEPVMAAWGTTDAVPMGSSLKLCGLVDGTVDADPRIGATSLWDIAAGHAVVSSAGGCVVDAHGAELTYGLGASTINPDFLALPARGRLGDLLPDFTACAP